MITIKEMNERNIKLVKIMQDTNYIINDHTNEKLKITGLACLL